MGLDIFFKERLGEERFNEILQESVGKTYEELLHERDELDERVGELEKENKELEERVVELGRLNKQLLDGITQLQEKLEDSQECEDPVLRGHKNFSKIITNMFDDREVKQSMYAAIADRQAKEGIPLEEEE